MAGDPYCWPRQVVTWKCARSCCCRASTLALLTMWVVHHFISFYQIF